MIRSMQAPATATSEGGPLNDPRYKQAPYIPPRGKFTEIFEPSDLVANAVSFADFAFPPATQKLEIKSEPLQSRLRRLRKLFSRSSRKSNSKPCKANYKDKSEHAKEKELFDSAVSLSGDPLQTKSETTTSITTTPKPDIATITVTKTGNAHPGRRWMPGIDPDPFSSDPIALRRTHSSPRRESNARLKEQAARDAFFDSYESAGEEPNVKTQSQTVPKPLQNGSNKAGLLTLVTPRDKGGFELHMSGALRDVEAEADKMEFVTVNAAIQDQIDSDRAMKEREARWRGCPYCKIQKFSKRIKALFGRNEGGGKSGEERGRSRVRVEIQRLDSKIQGQLNS